MTWRNQLILNLLTIKAAPENNENAIDSKWSNEQEEDEDDIAKANFIESLQKQTDDEIFSKKVTLGLFNDYSVVPNEHKKLSRSN